MVRHVFSERVIFHAGDGRVAPARNARIASTRIPDGCRWCGLRPNAPAVVLASICFHYYPTCIAALRFDHL